MIPFQQLDVSQFQKIADSILEDIPGAKAVAEPQSNSLIYIGPENGLERLRKIIQELDRKPTRSDTDEAKKETSLRSDESLDSQMTLRLPSSFPSAEVLRLLDSAAASGVHQITFDAVEEASPLLPAERTEKKQP